MRFLGYIAMLLCFPIFTHAQVQITEIMYAPDGADSKHEWIEVCNSGTSDENIENWKFFENDTNHGLVLVSGTSVLKLGSCAIFADNSDTFATDYGSFSGNLFDSAFSLSNSGEALSLKNSNGEVVDSVIYSESNGAKDDGNSLHIREGSITAGTPTPGSEEGTEDTAGGDSQNQTPSGSSEVTTTNTTVFSYESVTIEPPQDVYIRTKEAQVATVGSFTKFFVESFDATGRVVEDGNVYWAFGDGTSATGREVGHRFLFEGTYVVHVTLTRGSLSDSKSIVVTVLPLNAELRIDENGEWVSVFNKGEHNLDLSGWRLLSSGQYFRIPENTIIQSSSEARFATVVTKLSSLKATRDVVLVYQDGKTALTVFTPLTAEILDSAGESPEQNITELNIEKKKVPVSRAVPSSSVIGFKIPEITEKMDKREEVDEIASEEVDNEVVAQTAAVVLGAPKDKGGNSYYWYLGLAALLLLAIVGVLLIRPRALIVDGFEVIETKE